MTDYDVLVAGGGLAGLTAALFAARNGRRTLVLAGQPGGAIVNVSRIDDFPGFPAGVAGYELFPAVQEQATTAGAEISFAEIQGLERTPACWIVRSTAGELTAGAVIVATGHERRRLDVPGADRLIGHGVSDCAVCDGFAHRGRPVVVVGGGDAGVQAAIELASIADTVVLVERGDALTAQHAYRASASQLRQITVRLETEVVEILGEERVAGVLVQGHSMTDPTMLEASGVFVYAGATPRTRFLDDLLELEPDQRVRTDAWMQTTAPGLFAAGSIRADSAEQAVTAAGDGATAGIAAHRFLLARQSRSPAA